MAPSSADQAARIPQGNPSSRDPTWKSERGAPNYGCAANKEEMRGLILVTVGAASRAAGGFIALRRAHVERARSGRVTVPTVIAAVVAYLGPSVCSLLASWWSAWLLPLPRRAGLPARRHFAGGGPGRVQRGPARVSLAAAQLGYENRPADHDRPVRVQPQSSVDDVGAGAARCGGRGPLRRRAGADRDLLGRVRVCDPGGRAGAGTDVRRGVPQVSRGRAPIHAAATLPMKAENESAWRLLPERPKVQHSMVRQHGKRTGDRFARNRSPAAGFSRRGMVFHI